MHVQFVRIPLSELPQRLAQHPFPDRHDQPGLLGERDDLVRRHELVAALPAQQRLEAGQAFVLQIDDRLEIDAQLAAVDGAAQIGLQPEELHGALVHGDVEDLVARLAAGLGAVHGDVGVAQHVLRPVVAGRAEGDADADRGEDLVRADAERHEQRDEHGELVAAEARHGVARAEHVREALRDRDEELVAEDVAEGIVHDLEAVEIEEEHREHRVGVAALLLHGPLQAVHEEGAVRQVRERVVKGVVGEAIDGDLALGDVGLRAGEADRRAAAVAHRQAAAQHPAVRAVAAAHPMLALQVRRLAAKMAIDGRAQQDDVVGMHARQPLLGRVADLLFRVAEHRLPSRRVVDLVAAQVPHPQPVVRAARGQRVALLALAQRLQRAALLEGVADGALQQRRVDLSFDEIVGGAGAHGGEVDVAVALAGEEDQRRGDAEAAGVVQELEAVVLAEAVVDEGEVVAVARQRAESVVERRDPVELEARAPALRQEVAREDEVVLVVLDEQDPYGARVAIVQCFPSMRSGGSSTISIQ